MFLNKRFEQASVAFSRAEREREARICDAYHLRENARVIPTIRVDRKQAFITAAKAFISCALESSSANERLAYYGVAGECYSEARDPKNAGDNYRIAEQYPAAACAYREGEHFDEMVEVITQHENAIGRGLVKRLATDAKVHYFKVYFNSCPATKHA